MTDFKQGPILGLWSVMTKPAVRLMLGLLINLDIKGAPALLSQLSGARESSSSPTLPLLTLANTEAKLTMAAVGELTARARESSSFWAICNSQQTVTKVYTNHFRQLSVAARSSIFTASPVT